MKISDNRVLSQIIRENTTILKEIKHEFDEGASDIDIKRLDILTTIVPISMSIRHQNLSIKDDVSNTFVDLMCIENSRNQLLKFISSRKEVISVFKEVTYSKNGILRMDTAQTSLNMLLEGIDKSTILSDSGAKHLAIILIQLAFRSWGILANAFSICTLSVLSKRNVDKLILSEELKKSEIANFFRDIKFLPIQDLQGITKSASIENLADVFVQSLSNLKSFIISINSLDDCLDCILPRIKAYIYDNIEEHYEDHYEKETFKSPIFSMFATNLTLIKLALVYPSFRPVSPAYSWSSYDVKLKDTIYSSKTITIKNIAEEVMNYKISRIGSSKNNLKMVMVSKPGDNIDMPKIYSKLEFDKSIELIPYNKYDQILNLIYKGCSFLNTYGAHQLAESTLASMIDEDTKESILYIGIDISYDLDVLAAAMSDAVFINIQTGKLFFSISNKSNNNLRYSQIDQTWLTSDPSLVIFATSSNCETKEKLSLNKNFEPQVDTKYDKISDVMDNALDVDKTISVDIKLGKSTELKYSENVSFQSLFFPEKKEDLVYIHNLQLFRELLNFNNTISIIEKFVESYYNASDKRYMNYKIANNLGPKFDSIINDFYIKSLVTVLKHRIRENNDKPNLISNSAIMKQKLINGMISLGMFNFILENIIHSELSTSLTQGLTKYIKTYYMECV